MRLAVDFYLDERKGEWKHHEVLGLLRAERRDLDKRLLKFVDAMMSPRPSFICIFGFFLRLVRVIEGFVLIQLRPRCEPKVTVRALENIHLRHTSRPWPPWGWGPQPTMQTPA